MNREQREQECRRFMAFLSEGFSREEYYGLVKDGKLLHTWAEHESNGEIQRDEETGKCFRYYGEHMDKSYKTADRETPAIKRVKGIASSHGVTVEIQGDPRGASVCVTLKDGRQFYF